MNINYITLTMMVEGMSITASAAASTMHVEIINLLRRKKI